MPLSGPDRWMSSSPGRRVGILLPLVVAVDLIVVLALGLLPLDSIAGLRCDAVLRGGEPKADPSLSPLISIRQGPLCSSAKSGRVLVMLGVGVAILLVGSGAILAPADRLERFLVRRAEDDEAERREEEAWRLEREREAEARESRVREERATAERMAEARAQAKADRRADQVARARAARLRARSEAGAEPAKKASKPTKKAGKKVAKPATKKASKKVAKKVAKTSAKAGAKAVTKKVVSRPAGKASSTGLLSEIPTGPSRRASSSATRVRRAGTVRTRSTPPPADVAEPTAEMSVVEM